MADILEVGNYRARAVEGALGLTQGGKEQVAVKFSLLDFAGKTITWFGFFTENTTQSTFRALRTAGWRGQDLADLADLSNPENPEVLLVIEHETYKDKVTAKVRWVNSAGGLALKNAMAPEQAKTFSARMREQVAAFDAATKQGAPPSNGAKGGDEHDPERLEARAQEEASAGKTYDDIPF